MNDSGDNGGTLVTHQSSLFPADLFWGTRGPRNAPIAVVGECWGEKEDEEKRPFVGGSGWKLDQVLDQVGLPRSQVFMTNLIPARPPHNNIFHFFYSNEEAKAKKLERTRGLYPRPELQEGLRRLRAQLRTVNPRLVVGVGNYPLWALTDSQFSIKSVRFQDRHYFVPTGIALRRGSQTTTSILYGSFSFVPTYHPAAVLRQPELFRLLKTDFQLRVKPYVSSPWQVPSYRFAVRPSFDHVMSVLSSLRGYTNPFHPGDTTPKKPLRLANDLETRRGLIACIGLAWSATEAICVPLMCVESAKGYWEPEQEFKILKQLNALLTDPGVELVGQNYIYDMQYIALFQGIKPRVYMDTMWAWHLCNPNDQRSLNYLSSIICKFHRYWKDEGKEWDARLPEEQLWNYNCLDCVTTWEVSHGLDTFIDRREIRHLFNFQMQQFDLAVEMMLRGCRVSDEARRRMMLEVEFALRDRELWLESIVPNWKAKASVWHSSPHQQRELFYELLGLQKQWRRKGVKRGDSPTLAVDDDALDRLKVVEPLFASIFERLREVRSLRKFLETPGNLFPDPDGRVRCTFAIGPETFRWRSGENALGGGTNLQNISKGNESDE